MSNPLQRQVGGDHYRTMKIQPIEFATVNRLDPCAFSILKYVSRHRTKLGRQDVEKAIHFFDLRCSLPGVKVIPAPKVLFGTYCRANELPAADAIVVQVLGEWVQGYALDSEMRHTLDQLLSEYDEEPES